ncbi:hypothetical protein Tco_0524231 [Tanacetum coccineum]
MVWRSASLRYKTGEKKLNKVDFISQGVELGSRILATMTKTRVKFNLSMRRRMNWMVVKEIEYGILEEMEKFGWWFEQDIDGESEDGNEKKLVMVNEEGWMS